MVNVSKNRALVRAQTAQLKLRVTEGPSEADLECCKNGEVNNP